ncbi:MAG: hypothetical protein ACOY3I_02030 [Verrucomicrobiota bacterium]
MEWEKYKETIGTIISGILAARLEKPATKESLSAHVIAIVSQWNEEARQLKNLTPEYSVIRALTQYIQNNPEKFSPERRQFAERFRQYKSDLDALFEQKPELVRFDHRAPHFASHPQNNLRILA